jgi:hypothetical protein
MPHIMATIYRILKYEGPQEWLERQLDKSLSNGIKHVGEDRTVTIATVDPNDADTIEFCRDQLCRMTVRITAVATHASLQSSSKERSEKEYSIRVLGD